MKKRITIILVVTIILLTAITIGIIIKNKRNNNFQNRRVDYIEKESPFNLKLIKEVNKNRKENYLISPYSIEIALNLLKEGANNNTFDEIDKLISNRDIPNLIVKDRIGIANAAFIKEKYKKEILQTYTEILKNKYNSEILYDEFKTPAVINDWVNNKTNGMIDKILDEIDKDFILGLANAIAIDVKWDEPFECINTTSEEFKKDNGDKIKVEMMHKTLNSESSKYLENKYAKGIIVPYMSYNKETGEEDYDSDNNLEFIGILPNSSIDEYIEFLNNEKLRELLSTAKTPSDNLEIKLALPRFKYDYDLEDFKDVLINLGIKDAFDKENADFTKIYKRSEIIQNLYVGEAIHKTHIDLNEQGTKAAAVTYFGLMKATGVMPNEKEIINIEFNKPFIYMIRDKKTNEILFFGVVYEPNIWHDPTCENVD